MKKNFFLSRKNKILLLCTFLSIQLSAQFVEPKFDEINPIIMPSCVFQDSYGFIWIGSQGGLVRYDGYDLKSYTQIAFDSTSLSNNLVKAIKEDKKGNLWIGTEGGGLNYFDQRIEKFTWYMHDENNSGSIGSDYIQRILVNNDGSLWLGTQDRGLIYMKVDSKGVAIYKIYDLNIIPNLPVPTGDNYVLDLYKDKKGKLWIGTKEGGLKFFNPITEEINHYKNDPNNPNSISSNIVSSICEDEYGNLWIGTGSYEYAIGQGLNKFTPSNGMFTHYKYKPDDESSLCSNNISSIIISQDNILWIGTFDNYFNSISILDLLSGNNPNFTHYSNLNRIIVMSIYEDKSGNMWFSFDPRSVYKFNKQQYSFIWYKNNDKYPSSLNLSDVLMVQEDRSGNLWFGEYGLDRYNPISGEILHYSHDPNNPQGLSPSYILSICEDQYGYYWFSSDKGLNRLNPKTGVFTHIFENPEDPFGLKSNDIKEVLLSKAGELWVALSKSGLQLYNIEENRFYHFDLDTNSAEDELLTGIYEDKSGTLWCNTLSYGCFELDMKDYKIERIKHYSHSRTNRNSLSSDHVVDIIRPQVVDSNAVWIATRVGLDRLDLITGTFTHFYMEDGLPSNKIYKLLEDNEGNVWCSCAKDIAMYNIRTGEITSYSEADGLPFNSFGTRPQNACKTADGQLIFAGSDGAVGFYPEQMKKNSIVPPVYLTDFKGFHESVKLDTSIQFLKKIELPYYQNVFSFEFAALNFSDPEKNQYAYKLEGLYDDWIYNGNERVATFTNIEPGEYIFRVKGSNNHGLWNEDGASVKIIILPPWWATTWAYVFYALVVLGIIYFTWKLQLKRIRIKNDYEMSKFEAEKMHEVDELKNRFFANISHEFRTPLTLILGLAKKTVEKSKDQTSREDAGVIRRNAKRLHGLVNQLLDLSKLESGNMALQTSPIYIIPLLKGLVLSFASFAERKRITLKFNSEDEEIVTYIDKEKIEKIVTNLLSNAFKFTPQSGQIIVSVQKPTPKSPPEEGTFNKAISPRWRGMEGVGNEVVEIKVSDTGIGIPKERIDKIFDRFYQVDSSHTREQEGTGLGLALTKELVELHKGRIRVESSEGKGSIFNVTIPLGKEHLKPEEIIEGKIEKEEIEAEEVEVESEYEGQKERSDIEVLTETGKLLLLIVEDNTDVRNYIKEDLQTEYRILEAVNGEEGLNQAIKHIPDLIISDIMMPKMDGFEMCEKLKRDERTSHIPIIILTAKATDKDKIVGFETGADEYVMKPFDNVILKSRIKNLIHQRERLREHFIKEGIFQVNDTNARAIDKIFLKKAIDVINKHISDETFGVEVFADEIAMSKSQLRRKLVALVGESPGDLIRSVRLRKAAKLLEQNFGNVSEIAAEVGFNNPSNFAHVFKKHFGVSPTEYLNSKKT